MSPEILTKLQQAESNYKYACNEDEREQYRNEIQRLKHKIRHE